MSKISELEAKIIKARHQYYNGESKISDRVFDAWVDELKELDPKNKAVTSVGAPVASEWKKAHHQIPMGSLDKVNTPQELSEWVAKVAAKEKLFVTEKLDGLSIELVYEDGKLISGVTRGDGSIGEDITINVVKMGGVVKKLPVKFNGSLRGEIILTKSNWQKHFPDKANPRNAASGVSKRLDSVGAEHLDIMLYQALGDIDFETEEEMFTWLTKMGCNVPTWEVVRSDADVNKIWRNYQDKFRDKLDYDIDGIVVRINNKANQDALGDHDLKPKGAKAFKFENEAKTSIIKSVIWQTGNSGRITPVANFEPVTLMGAKVERASIYNIAYINELGIGVGAEVLVVRANDVIPRVEEVVKKPKHIEVGPNKCPVCNAPTRMDGENLVCTDVDKCSAQIVGRIKNWVSELNILELGDTLMEKLVAKGLVKNVADLYTLTVDQLANLDRMGEKSAQNVYDSLWKNNPVPLDIFLGGLSIPLIGSSSIRLLIEAGYDNLDAIMSMTQEEMENIKGMGPMRAESLVKGLKKYKSVIASILDNGVIIKKKIVGKLTGSSLCFTGTMTNKRAALEQMVIDNGGTIKSSVGKGLTFLVINDLNSTSSKATSAKKLGTKLINEDEFLGMIK